MEFIIKIFETLIVCCFKHNGVVKNLNNILFTSSPEENSLSLNLILHHLLSDRVKTNINDVSFTFDLFLESFANHPFMQSLHQLITDRI